MIRNAMRSWRARAALIATLALMSAPAMAAQRAVTDETVTVGDIAMAPLDDLNIARDPIPFVLQQARLAPYADDGLTDCAVLLQEIGNLDAVLGEDFDTATPAQRSMSAGKMAKNMLTSLIPYRGLLREVTGANSHEHRFREAIAAGLMRRAYLKGIGQALDCPYPARPHPPLMVAATVQPSPAPTKGGERTGGEPVFVSHPVVQNAN